MFHENNYTEKAESKSNLVRAVWVASYKVPRFITPGSQTSEEKLSSRIIRPNLRLHFVRFEPAPQTLEESHP